MCLSVGFIIVDILSVTPVLSVGLPDGINPFWKFAFVFKCFTDTIILDDFKTALDKLKQYKMEKIGASQGTFDDANGNAYAYGWTAYPSQRRGTEFSPWNESRGVTSADRPEMKTSKKFMDTIDLEMNYWTRERREGESSRSTNG
jgi:hypothetical protein